MVLGEVLGAPLQWAFGKGLAKESTENSRHAETQQLFIRADDRLWVTGTRHHREALVTCRRASYKDHGIKWLLLVVIIGAFKKTIKIVVINHYRQSMSLAVHKELNLQ